MVKENNHKMWYILGGVIIAVLLIAILVIQVQNKQKQNEIQKQMQREAEQKQFCDSLQISIEPFDLVSTTGMGIANVGANYKFCSNKATSATSIVTLKNGRIIRNEENLDSGSCHVQQMSSVPGDNNGPYIPSINCDDIKSIELVSTQCPQVKVLVTDMKQITCGM
jgi:hypothetical protein